MIDEELNRSQSTDIIGRNIIYLPSVTSTMDIARLEAQKGAVTGTVIIAGEQKKGRGRLKRTWLSSKGSLALSIILRPELSEIPQLIMVASLAVIQAIEGETGLKAIIKWPNDVLINDKKVCGILIENNVMGNMVIYSIIGIGINVNIGIQELGSVTQPWTSLSQESGVEVELARLENKLFKEFDTLYNSPPQLIFQNWRDSLVTLGKEVTVNDGQFAEEGVAESVNADGGLNLRRKDGKLVTINVGDVSLRNK